MNDIESIRFEIDIDELTKEYWSFFYVRDSYVLDNYVLDKKKTKRHKFRTEKAYCRIRTRNNTITVEDVPLTAEIKQKLKEEMLKKFRVEK